MMMYSAELYRKLASDPGNRSRLGRMRWHPARLYSGTGSGIKTTGGMGHYIWFATGRNFALKGQRNLFPLMSIEKVLAATYLPTDGYLDPSQLCNSLANEAKTNGRPDLAATRVTAINTKETR